MSSPFNQGTAGDPGAQESESKAYSAEEMQNLAIEAADFTEALGKVQPSARREGFTTIPELGIEEFGFGPENVGLIFPMIASHLKRDNDQQNHWVFRGLAYFQTNPFSRGTSKRIKDSSRFCL